MMREDKDRRRRGCCKTLKDRVPPAQPATQSLHVLLVHNQSCDKFYNIIYNIMCIIQLPQIIQFQILDNVIVELYKEYYLALKELTLDSIGGTEATLIACKRYQTLALVSKTWFRFIHPHQKIAYLSRNYRFMDDLVNSIDCDIDDEEEKANDNTNALYSPTNLHNHIRKLTLAVTIERQQTRFFSILSDIGRHFPRINYLTLDYQNEEDLPDHQETTIEMIHNHRHHTGREHVKEFLGSIPSGIPLHIHFYGDTSANILSQLTTLNTTNHHDGNILIDRLTINCYTIDKELDLPTLVDQFGIGKLRFQYGDRDELDGLGPSDINYPLLTGIEENLIARDQFRHIHTLSFRTPIPWSSARQLFNTTTIENLELSLSFFELVPPSYIQHFIQSLQENCQDTFEALQQNTTVKKLVLQFHPFISSGLRHFGWSNVYIRYKEESNNAMLTISKLIGENRSIESLSLVGFPIFNQFSIENIIIHQKMTSLSLSHIPEPNSINLLERAFKSVKESTNNDRKSQIKHLYLNCTQFMKSECQEWLFTIKNLVFRQPQIKSVVLYVDGKEMPAKCDRPSLPRVRYIDARHKTKQTKNDKRSYVHHSISMSHSWESNSLKIIRNLPNHFF
ncbi:hypothetical protein DFA_07849 [Cavenderia fasciculata]|uniref:F-box domain-containing protein n=1 Tax=Cavenderia fasciculata TaxID=261658 RepID=F4Q3Q3_CACFS|nr:uncharacterized protein DFA_07849 [Cavenderia fasciculata]EGG16869.1 hypothetical protein DFA_07849 [Cavenderia fasciculata]|eukprot:XP_004355343.1 hypothetical protein DFA_07849 [Cavenderia fasciculata]